ncbi:MAG: arginine--tRNA ligase [Pseudomonadota bacterium]
MDKYSQFIIDLLEPELNCDKTKIFEMLERPKDENLCDLAFPCFFLAKEFKKAPNQISQDLCKNASERLLQIPETERLIDKIESVGPYVNFFLNKPLFVSNVLNQVLNKKDSYFSCDIGKDQVVVMDYSSPNIAKPFSIGHLRSTNIGSCIKNILKACNYKVIGINHLGDWGMQFAKIIVAYRKWSDDSIFEGNTVKNLLNLYVKYHQEAKLDETLDLQAAKIFNKLEAKDPELIQLWKKFLEIGLIECKEIYEILEVEFEHYTGESFYNDKMEATIAKLNAQKLTRQSEGALIIDLEEYGMPPFILKKSDGGTLYATRDLTAIEYRQKEYNFDQAIYIVGSEQKLHFKQLFKVCEILGHNWASKCSHVDFGLIHFKDGAMSTREGKVIFLKDVINKATDLAKEIIKEKNPDLENIDKTAQAIGIGAIKFFDLSSKRTRDIQFDWNEILNFDGETGPYIQYTHVRLASLLRKSYPLSFSDEIKVFNLLETKDEFYLVKRLSEFKSILEKSANEFEPSLIAQYLISLSKTFNRYYNASRIINEDDQELTKQRMHLVFAIKLAINNGLSLLGIKAPERM